MPVEAEGAMLGGSSAYNENKPDPNTSSGSSASPDTESNRRQSSGDPAGTQTRARSAQRATDHNCANVRPDEGGVAKCDGGLDLGCVWDCFLRALRVVDTIQCVVVSLKGEKARSQDVTTSTRLNPTAGVRSVNDNGKSKYRIASIAQLGERGTEVGFKSKFACQGHLFEPDSRHYLLSFAAFVPISCFGIKRHARSQN